MQLHTKLNHERKLHQTECEALEMKLQELSLVSEEDVKANEHLRSLLARANADRERLQAELERAHQRTGQPQQSNSESRTNELSSTLAEVGLDGLTVPQSMEEANVVIKASNHCKEFVPDSTNVAGNGTAAEHGAGDAVAD